MHPPLDVHQFWSLDRDTRDARIAHAIDTGGCSVCQKAITPGQPRNGLIESHWECGELPPLKLGTLDAAMSRALRELDTLGTVLEVRRASHRGVLTVPSVAAKLTPRSK